MTGIRCAQVFKGIGAQIHATALAAQIPDDDKKAVCGGLSSLGAIFPGDIREVETGSA